MSYDSIRKAKAVMDTPKNGVVKSVSLLKVTDSRNKYYGHYFERYDYGTDTIFYTKDVYKAYPYMSKNRSDLIRLGIEPNSVEIEKRELIIKYSFMRRLKSKLVLLLNKGASDDWGVD